MKYECQNIFMMRIPALSIDEYKKLDNSKSFLKFLEENREIAKVFDEALLFASLSIYTNLKHMPSSSKKLHNLEIGVGKYLIRMMMRPTPYGLFSGVNLGRFADMTDIIVNKEKPKYDIQVDIYWLEHIIHEIENQISIEFNLKVIWNENCYKLGDRIKNPYFSNHGDVDKEKSEEKNSIRYSKLINIIYNTTQKYTEYSKLKDEIRRYYDEIPEELIDKALFELIENEYLLTELRLPSYCEDCLEYLINKLSQWDEMDNVKGKLLEIQQKISSYMVEKNEESISELYKKMSELFNTTNYLLVNKGETIETCVLSKKVKRELENFVDIYTQLLPREGTYSELNKFKEAFKEEYGSYVRVPLIEIIDENKFNGLSKLETETPTIGGREAIIKGYIDRQIVKALINKEDTVKIDGKKLIRILQEENIDAPALLPPSFDLNIFITGDIQKDQYNYAIGPNFGSRKAGKMFQRFAKVFEPNMFNEYNAIYEKEKENTRDNYIIVEGREIETKGRVTNVINQTCNHDYHLDIACVGGEKGKVSLSELSIGITDDNRLFIFSEKLGKICKIISDNMLNTKLNSRVLYLLKAISDEYEANVMLRKFMLYENIYNMVPRIMIDNIIVSLKTWKFSNQVLRCKNIEEFKKQFEKIRSEYQIDKYVYCCESDNRLILNLDKEYAYEVLYSILTKTKKIELTELEPGILQNSEIVKDQLGKRYISEFVFSFVQKEKQEKKVMQTMENSYKIAAKNRVLEIGENGWIYLKIYGIGERSNELLVGEISDFIDSLAIEKWFFIRYADPSEHLRLRMKFFNVESVSKEITKILNWIQKLRDRGMITKVIFDTYVRENNRYGGMGIIDEAENIFYRDSQFIVSVLDKFEAEGKDEEILYFLGIGTILCELSRGMEDMYKIVDSYSEYDKYRDDYRKKRKQYLEWCEAILNGELEKIDLRFLNIEEEYINWKSALKDFRQKYMQQERRGEIFTDRTNMVISFSHMYCNRLKGNLSIEQKYRTLLRHTLHDLLEKRKHER